MCGQFVERALLANPAFSAAFKQENLPPFNGALLELLELLVLLDSFSNPFPLETVPFLP